MVKVSNYQALKQTSSSCFDKLNQPQNDVSKARQMLSWFRKRHVLLGLLLTASHFPNAIKHIHQPHWT